MKHKASCAAAGRFFAKEEDAMHEELMALALACGADKAAVIRGEDVVLSASFRDICRGNGCGMYGRCWMCPPDIGEIGELMARVRTCRHGLLYQTIHPIEDSYDFEGMMEAGAAHNRLVQQIRDHISPDAYGKDFSKILHLGAGGCRVCEVCAKKTGEPCRFPEKALASLEAYGVNVSKLAAAAGMKYINGQNTVTYFGAVFLGR